MPRIMPTMIDSNGKPGTGGNVIGTDTELEADVVAACVVVVTTDVLTIVGEPVAVVALVALVEVTDTVEEVLAAVLLEVLAAVVLGVVVTVTGGVV